MKGKDSEANITMPGCSTLDDWDRIFTSATPLDWGRITRRLIAACEKERQYRAGSFADGITSADFAQEILKALLDEPHLGWDATKVPCEIPIEEALTRFLICKMKSKMIDHFRTLTCRGEVSLDSANDSGNTEGGSSTRIRAETGRVNMLSPDPDIRLWELQHDLRSTLSGNAMAMSLVETAADTSRAGNINQQLADALNISVRAVVNLKKYIKRTVLRP
jgi:hypothetical protein